MHVCRPAVMTGTTVTSHRGQLNWVRRLDIAVFGLHAAHGGHGY